MSDRLKYIVSWIAWPGLLTICFAVTAYGFSIDLPIIFFNISYIFLAVTLFCLERVMPHEKQWHESDGQTFANIAHTLLDKGTAQTLVVFSAAIGLSQFMTPMSEPGHGIWPREWPLFVQVVMGVVVAEFGLYWGHRIAHQWPLMWRFHAVHHSVIKLWIINTGRFHFVDSLKSIAMGMAVLLVFGAPEEVMMWLAAVTAFIGILTHCNVEMRLGKLSWWFNTPHLHRWHHSRVIREGNTNYGENVMIWDHIFGTWFNPPDRLPPTDIGISDFMPPKFVHQLFWPFLTKKKRKEIRLRYKAAVLQAAE